MPPALLAPRRRHSLSLRPRPSRAPVGDNGGGRHRRPADTVDPAAPPGPPPQLPHQPPGAALPKAPGQIVRLFVFRLPAGWREATRPSGRSGGCSITEGCSRTMFLPSKNFFQSAGVGQGPAPPRRRCASSVTPVANES